MCDEKNYIKREFLFTSSFNGHWYPGFLAGNNAVAGKEWGDINVLAGILEQCLGIPSQHPTMLERIVEAQTGLLAYCIENPDNYFAESYRQDDLAVSRRFIMLRDELMMAGWKGDVKDLPERLGTAMSALAMSNKPENLAGLPDQLIAVISAIQQRKARIFHALHLLKDISREPVLVQQLISTLASTDTEILAWPIEEVKDRSGETDLSLARRKVLSGKQFKPQGDGTLMLLQGNNSHDSAEALACWLRLNQLENAVIIADEKSRPMLNAALRLHHLPAIGSESVSPYRSALQVLQLLFTLQWKPLDPARLLEFLQLPLSPIPRRIGRSLAAAVAGAPGIGSEAWNEAMSKGLADEEDADRMRERLEFWLPNENTMLEQGSDMPAARIHSICKRLSEWARMRSHAMTGRKEGLAREDESTADLLAAVCSQADRLSDLVEASTLDSMDVIRLMRLLGNVSGEGMGIRLSADEEKGIPAVATPAAILGPSEAVIWWNFTRAGGEYFPAKLFTDEERKALAGKGIVVPGPGQYALDLSREWRRPLEQAGARLILVAEETELGEAMATHPLWDEISAGWDVGDKNAVILRTGDALRAPVASFKVNGTAIDPIATPVKVPLFRLKNLQPKLREIESASSLESLAGCPLQYVLKYQAGLYPAEAVKLDENSKVRGNVGHRVIQEVFAPGRKVASREEAERQTLMALERIITAEGATLLMPGLETELAAFKKSMVAAALALWKLMSDHGLSVTGVEAPIDASTELCGLTGYIDLRLEDKKKSPLVLDMKYSEVGDKYYRGHLEKDEAVQLAVYSRSIGDDVPVAYLSLKDARFITTAEKGFPGARAAGSSSITETWRRLVITIEHIIKKQFKKKEAYATAVAGEMEAVPEDAFAQEGLALEPPCKFCDYPTLCGLAWPDEGGAS